MIKLHVDTDSIRVAKSSLSTQIFSRLYFQVDSDFFPAKNWDDFSVIILAWWLHQVRHMYEGSKSTFNFMDGPYFFEVYLEENICHIQFIEDLGHDNSENISIKIPYFDFLNLFKKAANQLIRNLPIEAENLHDVSNLKSELQLLQKFKI